MWAEPKRASTDRVLMCIHGGGFVSGSIYTHRRMFGHLAKAAGARVLLVSYHLLPEGVFPVPADDVTNAYRWLLDQGISAGRVAFAGDAVGGDRGDCRTRLLLHPGVPILLTFPFPPRPGTARPSA